MTTAADLEAAEALQPFVAIVRALAATGPILDNEWGSCAICGAPRPEGKIEADAPTDHYAECLWRRAVDLLSPQKEPHQ